MTGRSRILPYTVFAAFCAAFWAIGIGLFVAALNMAKRQAIVDVVGDSLLINRKSLFGFKQDEWTRDDLVNVKVGPSGMEVNDVPVLALVISPRGASNMTLFSSRDDDELRWLAWELRRALGLTEGTQSDGESAE